MYLQHCPTFLLAFQKNQWLCSAFYSQPIVCRKIIKFWSSERLQVNAEKDELSHRESSGTCSVGNTILVLLNLHSLRKMSPSTPKIHKPYISSYSSYLIFTHWDYNLDWFTNHTFSQYLIIIRTTQININPWIIIAIDYNRVIIIW